MNFIDRVSTKPGRIKLTDDNGNVTYYVMERADEPTEIGTRLNARNLNALASKDEVVSKSGGTFTGDVAIGNDTSTTSKFLNVITNKGRIFLSSNADNGWKNLNVSDENGNYKDVIAVSPTNDIMYGGGTFTGPIVVNATGYPRVNVTHSNSTNNAQLFMEARLGGQTSLGLDLNGDFNKYIINTLNDGGIQYSGGTFTGNAIAYSTNRTGGNLRNIEVQTADVTSVSTNSIIMVRK